MIKLLGLNKVLNILKEAKEKEKTLIAVLADPDSYDEENFLILISRVNAYADVLLIGGSHCTNNNFSALIKTAKEKCEKPVVLFPGPANVLPDNADALLYLSLISGRNPELLIGWHVQNAYQLKNSRMEIIPTGYILIDGGKPTSVSYISNTTPIPAGKDGIILSTALAGELLGLKLIYLEAGSGALNPVATDTIKKISTQLSVPLIVGGGICNINHAKEAAKSGATMLVIGNALEKDVNLLKLIKEAV